MVNTTELKYHPSKIYIKILDKLNKTGTFAETVNWKNTWNNYYVVLVQGITDTETQKQISQNKDT